MALPLSQDARVQALIARQLNFTKVEDIIGVLVENISLRGIITSEEISGTLVSSPLTGSILEAALTGTLQASQTLTGVFGDSDVVACKDITIAKTENKTFQLTVQDENDAAVNITGGTLTFTVKRTAGDTLAKITKVSTDTAQIEIVDAPAGRADIKLVPTDTSTLEIGKYTYDIWLTQSGGDKNQILHGTFDLTETVGNV